MAVKARNLGTTPACFFQLKNCTTGKVIKLNITIKPGEQIVVEMLQDG